MMWTEAIVLQRSTSFMYSVSGGSSRHMKTLEQLQELGAGEEKGSEGQARLAEGCTRCSKSPT